MSATSSGSTASTMVPPANRPPRQRDYPDVGSEGLRDFIPNRIMSAGNSGNAIGKRPDVYSNARNCTSATPALKERTPLEGVAEFLAELTSGHIVNEHLQVWAQGKGSRN
jgi:hypothetical protein